MRHVILDLGNCESDSLFGKDLVLTNAPNSVLKEISEYIKNSQDVGLPAVEVFMNQVVASGYKISSIASIEDVEVYSVSAEDY